MTTKIERIQQIRYVALDFLSASLSYSLLHLVRKTVVEPRKFGIEMEVALNQRFAIGLVLTSLLFVGISGLSGVYSDPLRRSRLGEFFTTIGTALLTSILLFFTILLNDYVKDYSDYYITFSTYFGVLLVFSAVFRFVLSTRVRSQIDAGILFFNTILVGSGAEALKLFNGLTEGKRKGYNVIGYVMADETESLLKAHLPLLGHVDQLVDIIHDNPCEDIIIAIESKEFELGELVAKLERTNVRIHVLPNLFSILAGQVKMESIGRSLVEVKRQLIKPHVAFIKRLMDVLIALILLLLSAPILLFSMSMIAFGSKGPVFFKQDRLGKSGKKFKILKLRSMYQDAEKLGPQLSKEDDPRITPWGRTMRKYRIDELPQFINVLKGEMSIVGPRPEREYYFNQIMERAPQYAHLLKVKPGITSWGMVKFGYAENVDEMLERARYDLIYTENINLLNDIKILFYTLVIVLQGRGK